MFINHKRCPDCGAKLKHYYWYCGKCGNNELTDWKMTFIMLGVFLAIAIVAALMFRSHLCQSESQMVIGVLKQWGWAC